MIKEAILKVVNGNDLNAKEAYGAMDEIMSGESSEVQMSAYLTALSMKGETIEEITASTKAMRAHCVKLLNDEEVLEIVGTGGDGSNTFIQFCSAYFKFIAYIFNCNFCSRSSGSQTWKQISIKQMWGGRCFGSFRCKYLY